LGCTVNDTKSLIGEGTSYVDNFPVYSADLTNVTAGSERLKTSASKPYEFAATQFGSLYFNRIPNSTYVDSGSGATVNFDSQSIANCEAKTTSAGVSTTSCTSWAGYGYTVALNFTGMHTSILYQSFADQQIINSYRGGGDYRITATIDPLPYTKGQESLAKASDAVSIWFLLVFSVPFVLGTASTFVVRERQTKSFLLQTVSGVSPATYWLVTYFFDIACYTVTCIITILLLYAFDVETLTNSDDGVRAATFLLLLFTGPAGVGFSYLITYKVTTPSTAQYQVIFVNSFVGLTGSLTCFILLIVNYNKFKPLVEILSWPLRLFPSFCLAKGLLWVINIETINRILYSESDLSAFSKEIAGYEFMFLVIESIVYIGLVIFFSSKGSTGWAPCGARKRKRLVEDALQEMALEDRAVDAAADVVESGGDEYDYSRRGYYGRNDPEVAEEEVRVRELLSNGGSANDLPILTSNVKKVYENGKVAVRGVTLGIEKNEVFGLLGTNGAGKTTYIGMLNGEFSPSEGEVYISKMGLDKNLKACRRDIGFCPQFDAHFDKMTGREHVTMYANLKGLDEESLMERVDAKISEVGLSDEDADRLAHEYSGGMRRKLSVAIATIGDPKIVFLDEPSTGMDPVSRRDMWTVIQRVSGKGDSCVIITTHMMEECEALAHRVGIMTGGRLRCIGTAQGLKNRYGKGFQVELNIYNNTIEAVNGVGGMIEELYLSTKVDIERYLSSGGRANFVEPNFGIVGENSNSGFDGNGDGDVELGGIPRIGSSRGSKDRNLSTLNECIALVQAVGGEKMSKKINEHDLDGAVLFHLVNSNAGSSLRLIIDDIVAFVATEKHTEIIHEWFQENFTSTLVEKNETRIRYEIETTEGSTLKDIFQMIEENKERLGFGEYSVSQTSLEQIFNNFAAQAGRINSELGWDE